MLDVDVGYIFELNSFVSHLPRILVHFRLDPAHNSGASVGPATVAGVVAAAEGGGCC